MEPYRRTWMTATARVMSPLWQARRRQPHMGGMVLELSSSSVVGGQAGCGAFAGCSGGLAAGYWIM